ncbi:hypothetical protein PQU95_05125 [Vogesella sp. DC21W]|uniref:Uncharacterized protein n=1 Tax=Vogesella aquatica TaxID=2984206 RepID=A0ABT5IVQ6_9NEIS|nr:hypothetical protein [Vogesella aquatica]MDC7716593.1 hypothetical protein [Vogesella aquatica]
MDTVIMPLGSSICQSTPADFDLMGGPGDGAIARVVCLRGRIGVTALGQLAPTMNDVGISAICYGELGALLHHLHPRHRVVPQHPRLLACHCIQLKLDAVTLMTKPTDLTPERSIQQDRYEL